MLKESVCDFSIQILILRSHQFNLKTKCSCNALENNNFTYSAVGGTSQLDKIPKTNLVSIMLLLEIRLVIK